jgi:hypothetical protein
MKEEVLKFIKERFQKYDLEECFCRHNCYWFAKILTIRFPYLKIYYLPITGHFVAGTSDIYFDWHGIYSSEEKPELFETIAKIDPLWYNIIIRDCVM